ncbi:hypothetical protein IHE45_08G164200 [Dioscorea alata]|uniref:Uncharacterized protein n=1 Tax=Dioscorea alata TaxID=55571 RepID=A0ACB7VPG5_DIOAL|nr:hypothetical protein IHE45_08G164200 [Dioscorea alata]
MSERSIIRQCRSFISNHTQHIRCKGNNKKHAGTEVAECACIIGFSKFKSGRQAGVTGEHMLLKTRGMSLKLSWYYI